MRGLGELEAAVMDVIWRRDAPATVRDVLERLTRRRQLAYTTVMTVMDNLDQTGLLARAMVGRAWLYEAALSRAEYTAHVMRDVLGSAGDRSAALAQFVAGMSPEESQELRELLRRRPRGKR
jgi:predicted transcriptional regulator